MNKPQLDQALPRVLGVVVLTIISLMFYAQFHQLFWLYTALAGVIIVSGAIIFLSWCWFWR